MTSWASSIAALAGGRAAAGAGRPARRRRVPFARGPPGQEFPARAQRRRAARARAIARRGARRGAELPPARPQAGARRARPRSRAIRARARRGCAPPSAPPRRPGRAARMIRPQHRLSGSLLVVARRLCHVPGQIRGGSSRKQLASINRQIATTATDPRAQGRMELDAAEPGRAARRVALPRPAADAARRSSLARSRRWRRSRSAAARAIAAARCRPPPPRRRRAGRDARGSPQSSEVPRHDADDRSRATTIPAARGISSPVPCGPAPPRGAGAAMRSRPATRG